MTIRVANAPCSWGVLEFGLEGETADCRQFLTELRSAGYAGTELGDWGFMPTVPDELRATLAAHDLPLLGAFVPVDLSNPGSHDEGVEAAVNTAALIGAVNPQAFIVLADDNGKDPTRTQHAGRVTPEMGLAGHAWEDFSRGAERIAREVLERTGVRTVFHHHCAGFIETPDEVAELMRRTDPGLLGLCFDTGHWTFGGGDAVAGYEAHRERIWHVHFKDCEPNVAERSRENQWDYFESVRNGVFCELGKGTVDFPAVHDALQSRGYDGWIVVEQDVLPGMGSPFESATRNREFLRAIGL